MPTVKSVCIIALAAAMSLSCALPQDPALQAAADKMSACEKVERLLEAYTDQFNAIKGPVVSQRYMDIWAAKVNAIGSHCQIWRSGQHTTYMCARNAPSSDVGGLWYEQAVNMAGQCLNGWQQQSIQGDDPQARGVVWSKSGSVASIAVQVVPTRGDHQTVYYFLGDRDKWF